MGNKVKVFLASSSELLEDRKEFEIFLGRRNKAWKSRGISLELVAWEDFLDVMSKTRLQEEYNQAIRGCDLFVMLFCTKVGPYTEEEFDTAFGHFQATHRPLILTYFKDDPARRGQASRADMTSLWDFQDKLKSLGHFQTEYPNIEGLKLHFAEQLEKLAADGSIKPQPVSPGKDPNEADSVIHDYLQALSSDLARLKLGEIDAAVDQTRQQPLQLPDIYVPLDTTLQIPAKTALSDWLKKQTKREHHALDEDKEHRPVSTLEVLATHRELTLLGVAGSGKSTFGAQVLLTLAQAWPASPAETLGAHWSHGPRLPIRVVLRQFAEKLPTGEEPVRAGALWDFIARELVDAGYGLADSTLEHLKAVTRSQGALVLFDGLDECGDEARRQRVLGAVRDFMAKAGPQSRFLLTARPYAWPQGAQPVAGVYELADLQDGQIEQFIRGWYSAMVSRGWLAPGAAEAKREDLLSARHRADLRPLAKNPLLLTLMASLHTSRGRLPEDRVDLYNDSVELLLSRWNRQIGADKALLDALDIPNLKLSDLRTVLAKLAFEVHGENVGKEGTADISEGRLILAFKPLMRNDLNKAQWAADYIEKRAGLLLGLGRRDGQADEERQFTFPHRTFQEFLAASHLAAREGFAAECVRLAKLAPAHWEVVLTMAARLAGAERGLGAADALIGRRAVGECKVAQTPPQWTQARLAGQQLLEIGLGAIAQEDPEQAVLGRVAGWLATSLPLTPEQGGLEAKERLLAGDVLAALGDPRFDPERFFLPRDENLGFERIPADPDYRMGRYPVTVGQFRAYLRFAGLEAGHANALGDPDNRPVRYVNWHEALAYCHWLQEQLATSPSLAHSDAARLVRREGWKVSLPSDLAWEKAARGGVAGAAYPWGDKFDSSLANTDESELGTTSPVGMYPANGYGLHDMAGNVWEWTESEENSAKLVRGGAWGSRQYHARCALRNWDLPGYRYDLLGFRVVLCSSPV